MHARAARFADPREIEPCLTADLKFDTAKARTLRASAAEAKELVSGAFLFPCCLPHIQEIDEVAAMDKNGSAVIQGDKSCLQPPPDCVRMQVKELGDLPDEV